VELTGSERIDKSWVSLAYQPLTSEPLAREGKREVRQILRTPPARLLMQDSLLMPGEARAWLVRWPFHLVTVHN
jgi:hypothetical protein